eukprot:423464-Pyramimonas_sp.AAC.3
MEGGALQLLAMVLSAVVHDFEHPGITNQFAVWTGLETAKIYNDQAVLENWSAFRALQLTDQEPRNFKENLSAGCIRRMRSSIIQVRDSNKIRALRFTGPPINEWG